MTIEKEKVINNVTIYNDVIDFSAATASSQLDVTWVDSRLELKSIPDATQLDKGLKFYWDGWDIKNKHYGEISKFKKTGLSKIDSINPCAPVALIRLPKHVEVSTIVIHNVARPIICDDNDKIKNNKRELIKLRFAIWEYDTINKVFIEQSFTSKEVNVCNNDSDFIYPRVQLQNGLTIPYLLKSNGFFGFNVICGSAVNAVFDVLLSVKSLQRDSRINKYVCYKNDSELCVDNTNVFCTESNNNLY